MRHPVSKESEGSNPFPCIPNVPIREKLCIFTLLYYFRKKVSLILLISGPFSISRHPMYLGMMAILLGVAIIHGTLITIVFPVLNIKRRSGDGYSLN